jgi:protease IV
MGPIDPNNPPASEIPPVPPQVPPPFPPAPSAAPPAAPTYAGPVPHAAPKRSGGRGWMWFAIVLSLVLVAGLGVLVLFSVSQFSLPDSFAHGRSHTASDLHEVVVRDADSQDRIAVISLEGVITGEYIESIDRTLVDLVRDQLDRAAEDEVKAVILKVDSPGGEVLASDEIYLLIERFQKENKDIPVIASMGSLAASGGYYVSAPCRWIVANELTMTGSIGVIFHSYNYRGLMDKVGIRPEITKSGKLKDMMSGEKLPEEELPEEKKIMQGLINESYARFKAVVRNGRRNAADLNEKENVEGGRVLSANWQEFADGRILSGNQALEIGLVDELGNFDVAVERAKTLAGIEQARLVSYMPPMRFPGLFSLLGQSGAKTVKVDLGFPLQSPLPQGRLYFISPLHLH